MKKKILEFFFSLEFFYVCTLFLSCFLIHFFSSNSSSFVILWEIKMYFVKKPYGLKDN